jgi:hypothetical protein
MLVTGKKEEEEKKKCGCLFGWLFVSHNMRALVVDELVF